MTSGTEAQRGKFIVLEGPDFCGKTTHTDLLAAELTQMNVDFVRVREPGGTDMGEIVRNILKGDKSLVDNAELLLFAAARAQIVQTVIEPALAAGKWVIADRFLPSTIAMQYYARGHAERLSVEGVKTLTDMMVQPASFRHPVIPDLTVFLMPDEEILEARAAKRREGLDRLEDDFDFVTRVRQGYRLLTCNQALVNGESNGSCHYYGIHYSKRKEVILQTVEQDPQEIFKRICLSVARMVHDSERVTQ